MRFDGVFGCSEERLDAQVLLDPFEEQFDLPATFVKLGNGEGVEGKIVGEEYQPFAGLRIGELDPPQRTVEALA